MTGPFRCTVGSTRGPERARVRVGDFEPGYRTDERNRTAGCVVGPEACEDEVPHALFDDAQLEQPLCAGRAKTKPSARRAITTRAAKATSVTVTCCSISVPITTPYATPAARSPWCTSRATM